jgi:acyl carrier protein
MNLDNQLKEILIRNTGMPISSEEIGLKTDLINDLALDSILIVNLFADLEEEFNILIRVQDIHNPILSEYQLLKSFITGLLERSE